MDNTVTVVDYGLGNIFSVSRAVERVGARVHLTDRPAEILAAERLILPGVGAFALGMEGLRDRGLVAPIQRYAASGRPLLGICLGMQMLVCTSEEFGRHEGLGIIPGHVAAIGGHHPDATPIKVPHIGWNALARPTARRAWDGTILEGVEQGSGAYFVHSFTVVPDRDEDRLADVAYGDCRISAAIQRGHVSGCQFHPEKSGPVGLRIVENFVGAA